VKAIELLRQDTAPRQTDDMCAIDAEFVEKAGKATCEIDCRERLRRITGQPGSWCVPRHDPEAIAEPFELAPPASRITKESME
jgi:hypothetical protein